MISKLFNIVWVALFGGCIHEYGNWTPLKSFAITYGLQHRYCSKCNKAQTRSVDDYNG